MFWRGHTPTKTPQTLFLRDYACPSGHMQLPCELHIIIKIETLGESSLTKVNISLQSGSLY